MPERYAEVVLLVEDETHRDLIMHYLRRIGVDVKRTVRVRSLPAGRSSGEQYVRGRYPDELRAFRSASSRRSTVLIVAIDADKRTVQQRLGQLEQAVRDSAVPPRQNNDRVAILIPKRNVETWIRCLNGQLAKRK